MEKILAIAEPRGIPVIEDAAQMAGGFWNGRGVGSWGAVGSFSFQQSKPIACGEGGICLTNDDEIARKLFLLKHIGYDRGARQGHGKKLEAGFICHNYRATAFQALICTEQLKGLKERVERDNESFRILEAAVADLDGVRMQAPGRLSDPQGYYTFHFIFDGARFRDIPRETLIEACAAEGASLGGGTHGPVYVHPLFNLKPDQYRFGDGGCPVCDDLVPHRVLGGSHESLYYPETARAIAAVVRKVAQNVDELRRYKKETT